MDKSWMSKDKTTKSYDEGVDGFLRYAIKHTPNYERIPANKKNHEKIPCPCTRCVNHIWQTVNDLRAHLFFNGIDQRYTIWTRHGEDFQHSSNDFSSANIDEYIPKASGFANEVLNDAPEDAPETIELVQTAEEEFLGDNTKFQKLFENAEMPLYPGCSKFTKLSALVDLYNLKTKGGWSDTTFSELLLLLKEMLPDNNEMMNSTYEAKKILNALGLSYQKIHACPNDCLLYWKQYKDLNNCPTCGESRWKVNRKKVCLKGVPAKVLWYFPIIPRLKRLYLSKKTAKDLVWHHRERKKDGILRHIADSHTWRLVDHKCPEIAKDPRNLRLAISADGINPHGSLSSRYSCWPVLTVIYNLPPWLCMKRKFMMLSLLISGPRQPGNEIDVYLAPLIEDLKILFDDGVEAYDAYEEQDFTLRAVLLGTISDLPALSLLCGCTVKGYNACPRCLELTYSKRLMHSKKISYTGHRRYLPPDHVYRNQWKEFNGEQEVDVAPKPFSGEQIYGKVAAIENSWGKKKKKTTSRKLGKSKRSEVEVEGATNWKKLSIFYEFSHWKYLPVPHYLDVMHIEKNVGESIVGTLLNIPGKTKDGLNARKDLQEMEIRAELAPKLVNNRIYLPPACYTLSKEEKKKFCTTLFELKVPEGYCSNFRNRLSMEELKLFGLKSHDYHMLMQHFLPLAIRSVMPKHVRQSIVRLCFFFNAICSKEVDIEKLEQTQKDLVETLCLLEKYFPPSFFDIMIHLTVHLVREVKLCGPVYFRWMYPFERFMKVLKGYVRNKYRPEGCIAEGYIMEESLEFCSEYFRSLKTVGIPNAKHEKTNGVEGTNLITEGQPSFNGLAIEVDDASLLQAHLYVLRNTTEVEPYIEKHMTYLRKTYPRMSKREIWLQQKHNKTFITWIRNRVEDELNVANNDISESLKWITHGPRQQVIKYHGYDIKGVRYHTRSHDCGKVTQNSGVSIEASGMHISSAKDNNPILASSCFYGIIDEIWLLDYHKLRIPVFKCDWVESAHGIKRDELGFTLVELDRLGHKNDRFILASQASQVFYVKDQLNPKQWIVFSTPSRDYIEDDNDKEEISIDCHRPNENVLPSFNSCDISDDSQTAYFRVDGKGIYIGTKNSNLKADD